jgi:hypothetical protein
MRGPGTYTHGMGVATAKDVDRALRRLFWPAIKDAGFSRRVGRVAWRDRADQVDVVQIRSVGSYNAGVYRVSSFSFEVLLGVYPRCCATPDAPMRDGALSPPEHHCEFRRALTPSIASPPSPITVWAMDAAGSMIDAAVEDARQSFIRDGLPWFESLDGLNAMLSTAETVEQGNVWETWGMGRLASPHRTRLVADLRHASRSAVADGREN